MLNHGCVLYSIALIYNNLQCAALAWCGTALLAVCAAVLQTYHSVLIEYNTCHMIDLQTWCCRYCRVQVSDDLQVAAVGHTLVHKHGVCIVSASLKCSHTVESLQKLLWPIDVCIALQRMCKLQYIVISHWRTIPYATYHKSNFWNCRHRKLSRNSRIILGIRQTRESARGQPCANSRIIITCDVEPTCMSAHDVVAFGIAGMTSAVLVISWLSPLAHKTPSRLVTRFKSSMCESCISITMRMTKQDTSGPLFALQFSLSWMCAQRDFTESQICQSLFNLSSEVSVMAIRIWTATSKTKSQVNQRCTTSQKERNSNWQYQLFALEALTHVANLSAEMGN